MAQPVSYSPYVHLVGTAAGTVQIATSMGNFTTYTVGTATTGTVILFDIAGSAVGTTAATQIISYTGVVQNSSPMVCLKRGLVAVVSGTVDALLGVG